MSTNRYSEGVRISQNEKMAIREAFKNVFYPEDELWIFGSRANLSARGGDIDIFIKTQIDNSKDIMQAKLDFLSKIFLSLEEQKIDVVIQGKRNHHEPIYDIAQKTGVRLL